MCPGALRYHSRLDASDYTRVAVGLVRGTRLCKFEEGQR